MRQRVALGRAALRCHFLVASGERHRLKRQEVDLLRVVERKLDDPSDLLVVDPVDDGDDRDDVDAGGPEIFNRAQFDVEQIAHQPVRIRRVSDAVELQIGVAETRLESSPGEFLALRELDPVGRRLHRVVADLLGVAHGVEEVRRHRGLAARELHRHLTSWLQRDRIVQHRLDLVPRELVDEADLVRIHEARIAHHVAAVGQIDREDRAASGTDGAAAVVMELFVVVRADVAAGEGFLEVLEKCRIDRHHVFEMSVGRTILDHDDFAVFLRDGRFDLADLLVEKDPVILLAVDDGLARFADAVRAERIGLAGPTEWRLHLLPRLLQRQVRPFRGEGPVGLYAVQRVKSDPRAFRSHRQTLLHVLHRLVHFARISAFCGLGSENQANWQDRGVNWRSVKAVDTTQPGESALLLPQPLGRYTACTSRVAR